MSGGRRAPAGRDARKKTARRRAAVAGGRRRWRISYRRRALSRRCFQGRRQRRRCARRAAAAPRSDVAMPHFALLPAPRCARASLLFFHASLYGGSCGALLAAAFAAISSRVRAPAGAWPALPSSSPLACSLFFFLPRLPAQPLHLFWKGAPHAPFWRRQRLQRADIHEQAGFVSPARAPRAAAACRAGRRRPLPCPRRAAPARLAWWKEGQDDVVCARARGARLRWRAGGRLGGIPALVLARRGALLFYADHTWRSDRAAPAGRCPPTWRQEGGRRRRRRPPRATFTCMATCITFLSSLLS